MNKDTQCTKCGRSFPYGQKECSCGYRQTCANDIPGCLVRGMQPRCNTKATIPWITRQKESDLKYVVNSFVQVAENNTLYYVDCDSKAYKVESAPVEVQDYNYLGNPFGFAEQMLITNVGERKILVWYGKDAKPNVLTTSNDLSIFRQEMEDLFAEEFAEVQSALAGKQDILTAGANIDISYDAATDETIISSLGGGASYTAGDNIQITGNVISATDTVYTAGENITITDPNVINAVIDLSDYYNKDQVDALIGDLSTIQLEVVTTLPGTGDPGTIYLIDNGSGYEQYVYSNGQWTQIGTTSVDLSDYYTKTETDALLANKQARLQPGGMRHNVTDATMFSYTSSSQGAPLVIDTEARVIYSYIEDKIKANWANYLDKIYPVGSIYTTVSNDNPEVLFGGTWTIVGRNRVLWGVASSTPAGQSLSEQLPNIKGAFEANDGTDAFAISTDYRIEGAFAKQTSQFDSGLWYGPQNKYADGWSSGVSFDASRSNAAYTDDGIVRPAALTVHFWQRVS